MPETAPFAIAHARAEHWGLAAKACLEGVAGTPANVGILYATEAFNQNLSSILTFLRETTRIEHWVGGVVPGLCAGGDDSSDAEYMNGGALAVMTGWLPEADFRSFSGLEAAAIMGRLGSWIATNGPCVAMVHGDPRSPGLPALVGALAAEAGFLVGGTVSASGPPAQVADQVVSGGLSGLLLSAQVPVVTALTQGCTPIGTVHTVTEAAEGVVMKLDGRSALEVLKEEAGELIARDIRRAAGYIHVGLPVAGSDRGDYLVRSLLGIDQRQGWLAVADRLEVGQKFIYVRRDPNAARTDMKRMLADITKRRQGRPVRAALYTSCVARGRHMFGTDGAELALVRKALGPVPLVGFFANGEICGDRLYGYTGVLTLVLGDPP
ncbi:MAG: FIST C-terminal domain-containing protein [Rhodospirillaceae bacterium]|nr:FIST C-terminal domain-containing protein [Rhodospirillales bacterium]